jgi:antirestriction protein ArdC
MRRDVYQDITDRIVRELENGVRPWLQPWSADHMDGRVILPLRHNGVAYRGVNVLALWMQAMAKGYAAPVWMTFKQALDLGGCVRKGEKGSLTVYADTITRPEIDEQTGEESPQNIHYMKGYTVFNVEQIDGLPTHYYVEPAQPTPTIQRNERVECFFAATRADIRHGGDRAYYACHTDHIQMPPLDSFRDAESYYATLAHEETHWTKHPSRLDRDLGRKRWGDEGYAIEELVALS